MKNLIILMFIFTAFSVLDVTAATCPSVNELSSELYSQLNQTKPVIVSKKQIKIAVIDTGVDYQNRSLRSALWMPNGRVNAFNFGEDLVNKHKAPQDTHGHGTHIAGIIVGLFPQAKIYALNYFDVKATGQQNLDNFTKAISLAIAANVDIINISGGGPEYSTEEHSLIKEAKKKNILIVSAGGNEGYELSQLKTYYPAQYNEENILSVANLNAQGFRVRSSNFGKEIQVGVLGTLVSFGLGKSVKQNCRTKLTGTSQSTAVVSALAAMIKAENPKLTPSEIKEIIISNSVETNAKEKQVSFSKRTFLEGRSIANQESSITSTILKAFNLE